MSYEKLLSKGKIGTMELKNRVVMSPMLMGFGQIDGRATEQLLDYYEERAKGGAGLIMTEITRINDKHGAAAFAQLGASQDYHVESLRTLADRIHAHGAKLCIQLHHPGRQNVGLLVGTVPLSIAMQRVWKGYTDFLYKVVPAGKKLLEKNIVPHAVAPSKCPPAVFAGGRIRALKHREIKQLVVQFADAAERCKKAGVDCVELHGTHGYLIQQFLSPYTNTRTDEYGGSLENRMRFLTEIIAAIRARCGDYPIIVRLTIDEFYSKVGEPEKGITFDMGLQIAKELAKQPIDAIDVSSAGYDMFNYWLEPTSFACGWRAYLAEAVKKVVSVPVIAANLIRSPEQAEAQLEAGVQDFVSLGRPHIADPYWTAKVQEGRANEIKRCFCCLYCIESMQNNAFVGTHGGCSANPMVGREKEFSSLAKNGNGRRVAVVGAGPAGLTAAELLGRLGFAVTVFEKEERLGGQLWLAARPPRKEKLNWCCEDLAVNAKKYGADIRLGIEATMDDIAALNPVAVFIATGAAPIKPRSIKGVGGENVFTTTQILDGSVKLAGKQVLVVGSGMTGLETAEFLSPYNKVTVIEMANTIAPGVWFQHTDDVLPRLKEDGAKLFAGKKLKEIFADHADVEDVKTGATESIAADAVVLSLGVAPQNKLVAEAKERFQNVCAIGDAGKTGRIADATSSAYRAVLDFAKKIG